MENNDNAQETNVVPPMVPMQLSTPRELLLLLFGAREEPLRHLIRPHHLLLCQSSILQVEKTGLL